MSKRIDVEQERDIREIIAKVLASLDTPAEPERDRRPFVNRPTVGKTARKRCFPPTGTPTNVGNPNEVNSAKGGKR